MRVVRAYEKHCGNISATCAEAGISRRTMYRWLESPTELNKKFRLHLARVRPEERLVDAFESAHMRKILDKDDGGDTAAIIYGLKTKGRHRGWAEREVINKVEVEITPALEQIRAAIAKRAEEKGISFQDELKTFLGLPLQLAPAVREKLEGEVV